MKACATCGEGVDAAVIEVLVDMGIARDEIRMDASLVEDLGIDSTELVELVTAIEKKFGIAIPDRVNVKAKPTVASLAAIVAEVVGDECARTA